MCNVEAKKGNGIPNIFPYKEQLLNQMERKENMDKELMEQLRARTQANAQMPKGTMEHYAQQVQAKVEQFAEDKKVGGLTEAELLEAENLMDPNARAMSQSKKAFAKELKKVIEASDVLIEVLDARDPEGCRCKELEQQMLAQGKKVLLVVNKIDLVPPQNSRMWQRYLRREFPCILFKSNSQQQHNLSSGTSLHKASMTQNPGMVENMLQTSKAIGSENLLNILKNYARVEGSTGKTKQQIIVGVIGFPNVGKSSLINSLKRSRAAPTGNTPGVTKVMQEIQLDKNIVLIDSPGVVLYTKDQSDSLILRQAIKVDEITDPFKPIDALLARVEREELLKYYHIAEFTKQEEFLGQIARKKGFLKLGGVPNFDQAARSVIRDFLNGKLKYYTAPPMEIEEGDNEDDIQML